MAKYDLSVAIIFKNEIRCLERCLQSLQPLRERLSVQLVMADTGATDGSRAVAERYADVLIDFPWINDFSAARNATLDRCRGRWTLVIDCDEWLREEDVNELSLLLHSKEMHQFRLGLVVQRNYFDEECREYRDIDVVRLLNMECKPRFTGAIHEQPTFLRSRGTNAITNVVLHHDGYIMVNDGSEAGKEKRERNLTLLREELEKEPEDLRRWMQVMESEGDFSARMDAIRQAIALTKAKKKNWEFFGPPIFSQGILFAFMGRQPELEEWVETARELFPNSYFTRIDVNYVLLQYRMEHGDPEGVVSLGEEYFKACAEYRTDTQGRLSSTASALRHIVPGWQTYTRLTMAQAYGELKQPERALDTLAEIEWDGLMLTHFGDAFVTLYRLSAECGADVSAPLRALWDSAAFDVKRRRAFLRAGWGLFPVKEPADGSLPSDLFLSLRGVCPLGDAAAFLRGADLAAADALLANADSLMELPLPAILRALKLGAEFPVPGKPLSFEVAETLAGGITKADPAYAREALNFAAFAAETDDDALWAAALAEAAVNGHDWAADEKPLELLRVFVRAESGFLARFGVVDPLDVRRFPPLRRFALHLANAFSVLAPSAVAPDFKPTVTGGVPAALKELEAAAFALPEQKGAVEAVLNALPS